MSVLSRKFGVEFEFQIGEGSWDDRYCEDSDDDYGNDYSDNRLGTVYSLVRPVVTRSITPPDSYRDVANSWKMHYDCDGVELKTPPSRWYHWQELCRVMKVLRDNGGEGEEGLGTHMHFDRSGLTPQENVRFVALWCALEPELFKLVNGCRLYSGWCDPIRDDFTWEHIRAALNDAHKFNFGCVFKGAISYSIGYPTWECRVHHSTLSELEVREWLMLLMTLIGYAKRQTDVREFSQLYNFSSTGKRDALRAIVGKCLQGEKRDFLLAGLNRRWNTYSPRRF